MSIEIIIDSHEEKLIEALESEYLKKECGHMMFDIATLEVGDIMYKHGDQVVCLIERKTVDDYVSSITDKRSKNQSIRILQLRKEYPKMIVIYLIEGKFINKDQRYRNGITRDSLYSSFINRVLRDQFTIYRSADISDTALIITKIYDKLTERLSKEKTEAETEIESDERIEYLKTIKLAKKENMTAMNCYVCQLSQIPGISVETADIITKVYPSMSKLIMEYERLTTSGERERLLSEILIPIAHNKSRRLGHVLSKRIYDYLYGRNETLQVPPIFSVPQPLTKIIIKLKKKN